MYHYFESQTVDLKII